MSTALNILLLCKSLPWKFNGGIQTHTWELSKALVAKGHKVSVLTGGPYRQAVKRTDREGIEIIEMPYFPGRYIKPLSMLAEELSFNISAKNWVMQNHTAFDIIHAQGRSGYLLYGLSGLRKKLIATVHGLITNEVKRTKWYNLNARIHAIFSTSLEKKLINRAARCLAVSQDLKKDINASCQPALLDVISNGVSLQPNASDLEITSTRFLFVGRLHPVKGIYPLVNAMRKAPSHICLDIIGNGPQYAILKRFIEKHKLDAQVRLLGAHSNEKIHETIPFYQALILPSFYETQGIVLMEANAHAVPVIASDLPSIRETVTEGVNGMLCNPHDSTSFIKAMTTMAAQPNAARKMGLRGLKRVTEHYSWERIANETIATYQKMAV